MNFTETNTAFRLMVEHPMPWKYQTKGAEGVILDAAGNVVLRDSQVSSVIFDTVWGIYFEFFHNMSQVPL